MNCKQEMGWLEYCECMQQASRKFQEKLALKFGSNVGVADGVRTKRKPTEKKVVAEQDSMFQMIFPVGREALDAV